MIKRIIHLALFGLYANAHKDYVSDDPDEYLLS